MPIARRVATVTGATLLSRLLGFARDVGIAAALGAGPLSDAYFAALQIPNLFRRLLAEGALNSAFVPIWLRIKDEKGAADAKRFGEEILGAMLVALGALTVLCIVFAPEVTRLLAPGFDVAGARFPLAVEFVCLGAPYIAIAGLVAVAASVLNAETRVGAAAFGLVIFNIVLLLSVTGVLLSGIADTPASGRILSGAIAAAGLAQLALVGGAIFCLKTPPVRPRFTFSARTRRFFARALPGVIAGGIPQLKLMAGAMIASSSPAAVSWLYYANRLYELPLGVVSVAISAVMVPAIAAGIRSRERNALASVQSRAYEIALGLALPAAVAFGILAEPIVGGLFERGAFERDDTVAVASALVAICAGLPGHVLEKAFGAVSFAHEDTRTPMLAALAGLLAAIVGALLLFPGYGHAGIAAAIAISGWVGATLMGIVLMRRGWLRIDRSAKRGLPRILAATIVMGAAILGARMVFASIPILPASGTARIATLAMLVAGGLAIYVAGLQILRVMHWRDIVSAVLRRI
jgi:putative peptidoglycan lipid II flippase